MRKIQTSLVAVFLLYSYGCAYLNPSPLQSTVASLAVTEALRYGIKDSARRTVIANYIDVYATAIRSIADMPTPDQLLAAIHAFIPASVKSQYPEIISIGDPLVLIAYNASKQNASQLYSVISGVATILENGAAPFVSH